MLPLDFMSKQLDTKLLVIVLFFCVLYFIVLSLSLDFSVTLYEQNETIGTWAERL